MKDSEFERRFGTEPACRKFLTELRWPDGPQCNCGSRELCRRSRDLLLCIECKRDISVTADTLFADLHLPLRLWFKAFSCVSVDLRSPGSTLQRLQESLRLGSYHTARNWSRKLRHVMAQVEHGQLRRWVEVDKFVVNTVRSGATILVAAERAIIGPVDLAPTGGVPILPDFKLGRIKLRRITDMRPASLNPALVEMVELGSEIETDTACHGLTPLGFKHFASKSARVGPLTGLVREVELKLKPWLDHTHARVVDVDHLDYSLDEFVFRFNRRRQTPYERFKSLIRQALTTPQIRNSTLRSDDLESQLTSIRHVSQ
jgi:hypothetical protein